MAKTYTWADLISYASQSYPRLIADSNGAMICDMVNSKIWSMADWRVSLVTMPPFYLVALNQDYAAPTVVVPSDFLGLRSALLIYNGTEPATVYPPLTVMRYLDKTYIQGRTKDISYQSDIGGFRIFPRCPSGIGVMDYQIECTYKKIPTRVTAATLMSTLPFEDQYFNVFLEGMKFYLKPVSQQNPQDYQNFMMSISAMAAAEAVNLGEQPIAPKEPLVSW